MTRRDKILIVDDDPFNISILRELLEGSYEVYVASAGDEALDVACRCRPDLVLLDIMMPGMSGYDACRKLRENEDLKYCKVVLVSAKAMLSERLKGYEAGADDYVTKPFDHDELLAKVKVFLRLKFMEEMDHMKSDFLTLVSHELRTPLTQIIGPAELLTQGQPLEEPERRKLGQMILDAASRIESTFEQAMLVLSFRSKNVGFELGAESESFSTVVEDVLAGRKSYAAENGVAFDVDLPAESSPSVNASYARLVLGKLIDKMIEWCPGGGVVKIDLENLGEHALLRVSGRVGEAEREAAQQVFDVFFVGDVRHHSGTIDLDLPLMSEIIRYFGGEIDVESSPAGEIEFRVKLPVVEDCENDESGATGTFD